MSQNFRLSRIEFIRSKFSNFSAHVSGVTGGGEVSCNPLADPGGIGGNSPRSWCLSNAVEFSLTREKKTAFTALAGGGVFIGRVLKF